MHTLSAARSGPFVVINAAAITPERMEIELFGVEQSNGSQSRKVGALEEAHGGTLFIDEIADMPRETQNKILRVLVDQTFQRVGGTAKVARRRPHHLVDRAQSRIRDRGGQIPRGPVSTGCRSCRSACRRLRSAATDIPDSGRLFHGADFAGDRLAEAHDRRRRHGGAAIA